MGVLRRADATGDLLRAASATDRLLLANRIVDIAGTATGTGTATADLTRFRNVESTSTGVGLATGSLEIGSATLSAVAIGTGLVSASLTRKVSLHATAAGTGTASAAFTFGFLLLNSGNTALLNDGTGVLLLNLSSVQPAPADLIGDVTGAIGTGRASASLGVQHGLSATATGSSVGTATNMGIRHLIEGDDGAGVGSGSGLLALNDEVPLQVIAKGVWGGSANLALVNALRSTAIAVGSVPAPDLVVRRFLEGVLAAAGTSDANLTLEAAAFSGVAIGVGGVHASLLQPNDLDATTSGSSSSSATLSLIANAFGTKDLLAVPSNTLRAGDIDPSGNEQDYFGS